VTIGAIRGWFFVQNFLATTSVNSAQKTGLAFASPSQR
jgi:hypothetical protein